MKGNQTVTPFPSRTLLKIPRVLELIRTAFMGSVKMLLNRGAHYVLTLLED